VSIYQIINRFIYRDLLYVVAGGTVIFFINYPIHRGETFLQYLQIINVTLSETSVYIIIFAIGILYLLGVFTQTIFHDIIPIFNTKAADKNIYKDKLSELQDRPSVLELLERSIYFKQIGSTVGSGVIMSLFVIIIKLIFNLSYFQCASIAELIIVLILIITVPICVIMNRENIKQEKQILNIDDD
jgi:hypothetical protein